jgi:hypothetical protein
MPALIEITAVIICDGHYPCGSYTNPYAGRCRGGHWVLGAAVAALGGREVGVQGAGGAYALDAWAALEASDNAYGPKPLMPLKSKQASGIIGVS